jgi:serine/threonine protein kinase
MVAKVAAAPTMFLQRLQASRLLDAERIDAAVKVVGPDEKALAAYLLREGLLTRFQARQLFAGATSFHVDKYVVLDCLGRGGTGIVYKARHGLMPNRYVALKTVDWHDLHRSEEAMARFRREIDIVARLDHPNVVRAFDVIHTRTQLYLVLEYIEGRDLGSLVKERGKQPVPEAVGYAVQAARGLAYAHRCGIVHRDIKPGNLLLTRDGVVKLSDLGLARRHAQDEEIDLTRKGIWLGTPEFMAPEQAEDAGMADARSDIYGLGATLFHLLAAELPLNGSSQFHCLKKLLTEAPRPLRDVLPDAPPELAAVVDRLRARDPQDRPATADEVIALLEPFLRKPTPSPAGPAATRWDGRRKADVVLEVLTGKVTPEEACRRYGVSADELERWQARFLEGATRALESPNAFAGQEKLRELHAKIGSQAMEIESLRKQLAEAAGS